MKYTRMEVETTDSQVADVTLLFFFNDKPILASAMKYSVGYEIDTHGVRDN